MRFAPEAIPFLLPFAVVAIGLLAVQRNLAAGIAAFCGLLVLFFFRVPRREVEAEPAAVLAAANGKITAVERLQAPEIGRGEYVRIVTFLSVFDVHVQRAPVHGRVVHQRHHPGRKVAAFRRDAGDVNERLTTVLERPDGSRVGVRQIAGLLARRAVSYVRPSQTVERGELIGLIKFGSRVDLLLPAAYEVLVRPGQRVREGLSVVARAPSASKEPATPAGAPVEEPPAAADAAGEKPLRPAESGQ